MPGMWSRLQTVTVVGTLALGVAIASGTAVGQQQERRSQEQQLQQERAKTRDQDIEYRVERRLARSSALAGADIRVAVEDRIISLSGTVGSEQAKERAIRIARRVRGVKEVKNELVIDQAIVDKRRNVKVQDEALAKQVATKLADETFPWTEAKEAWRFGWEVEGYTWEFDVDVDDGVVTLDGNVESHSNIIAAIKAARAVPGVRAVESELVVNLYDYRDLYHPYYHYPSYGYPYRYP